MSLQDKKVTKNNFIPTDADNNYPIKNGKFNDLIDAIDTEIAASSYTPTYKVYTALLSQSGTNAPVAVVLENTLGFTPVWSRTGIGTYHLTYAGGFTANKTWVNVQGENGSIDYLAYDDGDTNVVYLSTAPSDSQMSGVTSFEVRVYD
jgi:hypothetical protein